MLRILTIPAIAFVATLQATATAGAASLVITTEDYPPFNMQKDGSGEIVGISTDIVRAALRKTGTEYRLSLYPWARAYDMALQQADTCVYSTSRTEAREALFKWVGPLANNDWTLFGRADGPKLTALDDAKPYSIGGVQDDATIEYLAGQGFKTETVSADRLNPKKLAAKRIDFWASGATVGAYLAAREGVSGIAPVLRIKEVQLYLACNKGVAADLVDALNAAIKQLRDDGGMEAILKAYR
jgi:polar amino acid transport system substrate-binding protein